MAPRSIHKDIHLSAIPVFYHPEMVAESGGYSPSAGKPRLAVESWQALGIPLDIRSFSPVSREQIKLAHSPQFVDDLLDLRIDNGHGNRRADVAASLPFTSGSMLAAAREALRNGIGAVSPTSGFHHAGYAHAGGFCSLNGIAIAAKNLPAGAKVGLLDLDQHDPDGVRDIKGRLGLDLPIVHGYGSPATAERWLQRMPALILETFIDCDLLLVQLGADPHIDDELGGWLNDDQLRRRDRAVFKTCKAIGLPLAWCLAGGYQADFRKVLDVHDASLQECARAWLG